jgi:hypothetical protein
MLSFFIRHISRSTKRASQSRNFSKIEKKTHLHQLPNPLSNLVALGTLQKYPYTWQFTLVIDKQKCVTVNSWWRSRKTSCVPRHIFVGPKWTVTDWLFCSSWISCLSPITNPDPNYSDEKEHHKLVPNHHNINHTININHMSHIKAHSWNTHKLEQSSQLTKYYSSFSLKPSTFVLVQYFTQNT